VPGDTKAGQQQPRVYFRADMPDTTLRNLAVRGVARKLPYSSYATYKFLCTHLKK